MKRSTFNIFVAVALVVGGGCSSSSSPTSSATPDASADSPSGGGTSCNDILATWCDRFNSCAPLGMQTAYGDVSTCKSRYALWCTNINGAAGVSLTSDCQKAFANESCDDLTNGGADSTCTGTLANGQACSSGFQCTSGHCEISTGNCGVCAALPAAGASCTSVCAAGMVCESGRCIVPAKAGDSCNFSKPCAGHLSCTQNVCVAATTAGEKCSPSSSGPDPMCDVWAGFFCGSANVCQAITYANVGEPCGLVGSDYKMCKGAYCKGASISGSGTCAKYAADGAACDADTPCALPATCVTGLCRIPDPSTCK